MANAMIGKASRRLLGLRPSMLLRTPSIPFAKPGASAKRLTENGSPPRILRRPPCSKRLSGEIACMESLIPWHSATSAARLVSRISSDVTTFYEGT
ncbi:hypothetical protein O6H91_02G119100 [Diphasiastrum complanatum]|uniref:Uncharacterized protein n=1 Tax=Diphasiastrum complanatum TaxID=34168 RepID=A0ACC2EKA1_DIPCM|nr:hypothetical protein O6H91_02G119100 [Diphasiastrum complanatum]